MQTWWNNVCDDHTYLRECRSRSRRSWCQTCTRSMRSDCQAVKSFFFSKVYWKWCQTWTCSRKNIKIYVFKVESVYQISKDIHQREVSSFSKYNWRSESQSPPVPGISSSHCHKRGWIVKPLTQDTCYGQSPTCLSFVTNAIRIILKTNPTNLIYLQRLRESFQSLYPIYLSPASLTEARSRKVIETLNLRVFRHIS